MTAHVVVLVFALLLQCCNTLGLHTATTTNIVTSSSPLLSCRRKIMLAGGAAASSFLLPSSCTLRRADAATITQSGYDRVEGIGGGFDMLSDKPIADIDVLYPPSLNGTWVCERRVVSVEGDVNQAQGAWKLLGGTIPTDGDKTGKDFQKSEEKYSVRFVDLRRPTDGIIGLDGKKYYGDILDRAYEMEERTGRGGGSGSASGGEATTTVQWDPFAPNILKYERPDGTNSSPATELKVVQRKIEPQNNQGSLVGSNELIRLTTKTNGPFNTNFDIVYAARVQRRWRRSTTEEGDRVVEGLEIVKTYRVLDGIAGIEFPTSTVKSTIRLTRTYPTRPGSRDT